MKRFTAWLAGVAGGIAAYRLFRKPVPAAPPPPPPEPDPAEALRAKLAEAKAAEPEPPADPEARRKSVHEQARAAIDEMRVSDDPG